MASQITSLIIVYSTIYSGGQRKHQSSASLAFVWGIHRWPVNSPHKWPVTRMTSSCRNTIENKCPPVCRPMGIKALNSNNYLSITVTSHEWHGVSNHRHIDFFWTVCSMVLSSPSFSPKFLFRHFMPIYPHPQPPWLVCTQSLLCKQNVKLLNEKSFLEIKPIFFFPRSTAL